MSCQALQTNGKLFSVKLYELMESFFSNFEFVFELLAINQKIFNGAFVLISTLSSY